MRKAKRLEFGMGLRKLPSKKSLFILLQIFFISFLRRIKQRVGDNCDTPKIGIGGILQKDILKANKNASEEFFGRNASERTSSPSKSMTRV